MNINRSNAIADIAKLQGELRFIHVNAYLATTRLFTHLRTNLGL